MKPYVIRLREFIRNCYRYPTSHDDIVKIMLRRNKKCKIGEAKDGNFKIVLEDELLGDFSGALFYEVKEDKVLLSYVSEEYKLKIISNLKDEDLKMTIKDHNVSSEDKVMRFIRNIRAACPTEVGI